MLTHGGGKFWNNRCFFAVGAVIGNFFVLRVVQRIGTFSTATLGLLGLAASLLAFSQVTHLMMAIMLYMLIGVTFQARIIITTQAQKTVDPGILGRVESLFSFLNSSAAIVIYVVMGYLSDLLSPRWMYVFQAMIILFACFGVYKLNQQKEPLMQRSSIES